MPKRRIEFCRARDTTDDNIHNSHPFHLRGYARRMTSVADRRTCRDRIFDPSRMGRHCDPTAFRNLIVLAGTPTTTAFAGTSPVTTAFAPTTALSPMLTPRVIVALAPIQTL